MANKAPEKKQEKKKKAELPKDAVKIKKKKRNMISWMAKEVVTQPIRFVHCFFSLKKPSDIVWKKQESHFFLQKCLSPLEFILIP